MEVVEGQRLRADSVYGRPIPEREKELVHRLHTSK
jgi:hypothetical protein